MRRIFVLVIALIAGGALSTRACDTTCPTGNHWEWNDSKQTTGHCVADPGGPSSTSNSNASANSNQSQGQQQTANGGTAQSSSVANGGSASAVDNAKNTNTSTNTNVNAPVANGGVSQVKDSGNSSSNSSVGPISNVNTASGGSVKNSGNSSSTATGGSVKDSGNSSSQAVNNSNTSSQSVSGSSSAGSGNTTDINTNVEASKIPVATAYAPMIAPTVTCFKGASGAVQTMAAGVSFGVGRIDENCAILEAARSGAAYTGRLAFCKVYITNKYVRKAGVTLEDCLQRDERPVPVVVAPAPAPVFNILPAPVVAAPVPVAVTPVPVVQRETVQLVGTCPATQFNACKRHLDDALLRLHNANDPAASIGITGPIGAATEASRYLRDRATDPQRISLHIEDTDEVSIATVIEE